MWGFPLLQSPGICLNAVTFQIWGRMFWSITQFPQDPGTPESMNFRFLRWYQYQTDILLWWETMRSTSHHHTQGEREKCITWTSNISFCHCLQDPFLLIMCQSEYLFFILFLGDTLSACPASLYCKNCSAWWYEDTIMMALKRTWRRKFMGQDEKGEVIFNAIQKTLLGVTFMPIERITCVVAIAPPFIQNWARKHPWVRWVWE